MAGVAIGRWVLVGAGLGLGLGSGPGCQPAGVFSCEQDADCRADGAGGVCQPSGYCSFADDACESGQRYGSYAGDGLAGECVVAGTSSTGPVPSGSTSTGAPATTVVSLDDGTSSSSGVVDEASSTGAPACGALGEPCCPGSTCAAGICVDSTCQACVVEVEAEEYVTCARRGDGQLDCWGADAHGEVGDGLPFDDPGVLTPASVLAGVTAVDLGAFHGCALAAGLWCWGRDDDAQLGQGMPGSSQPAPVEVWTPEAFEEIAVGGFHNCARGRSGQAYCWGANGDGQVGLPELLVVPEAEPVQGLPAIVTVDAGGFHSCALDDEGTAWCWGDNAYAQLGRSFDVPEYQPEPVPLLPPVQQLALGDYHSCAREEDGAVWCWGRNWRGQLGVSPMTLDQDHEPHMIAGLPPILGLVSGDDHVCGLAAGGQVWCWGANDRGQLGQRPATAVVEPVMLPVDDVVSVAAGRQHTCVSQSTGEVLCLGAGDHGQLGLGGTKDAIRPGVVAGLCEG